MITEWKILYIFLALTLIVVVVDAKAITDESRQSPARKSDKPIYEKIRDALIKADNSELAGQDIVLTEKELLVDEIVKKLKAEEISIGYKNQSAFPAGQHFFKAKPMIDNSRLFDIIKKIPKGAALHIHNSAAVSSEWLIKNLTYRKDVDYCHTASGQVIFIIKTDKNCVDQSINIVQERETKNGSAIEEYDKWLEQQISMYVEEPCVEYTGLESAWTKFQALFETLKPLLRYLPIYKDYHYRMLEEHYDDGVYYVEMRAGFKDVTDIDGKKIDSVKAVIEVAKEFAATHPNFIGLKGIFTIYRDQDKEILEKELDRFFKFTKEYEDFMIGLDFVGQEDLMSLLDIRNKVKNKVPKGTNLFFHAGETNWWGAEADINLFDAILMNTKRIGHGYAILKHPSILEMVKQRKIGIEISVISNQVLHLVEDLRNHPAAIYLASNMSVVITNDDPTFWGAQALSYDWYLAFMAFSPAGSGLKILKQLAVNAITYSYLTDTERDRYKTVFDKTWNEFLDKIILNKQYYAVNDDEQNASRYKSKFLSFY